jgi:hypothetical protein
VCLKPWFHAVGTEFSLRIRVKLQLQLHVHLNIFILEANAAQ